MAQPIRGRTGCLHQSCVPTAVPNFSAAGNSTASGMALRGELTALDNVTTIGPTPRALVSVGKPRTIAIFVGPISIG